MTITADTLSLLLPALYRIRDAEEHKSLEALLKVLAEQAGVMESDIARLYENWFIETCDPWVVPYIGDLLGVKSLHSVGSRSTFISRARVGNTLRYRRRKGTATMLEQLARDVTGWPARAGEFFELLIAAQYLNHIRRQSHGTADLRRASVLELIDTAFDRYAHTVDVRRISSGRGRHNIPNVGLFLWRIQSYFMERGLAFAVSATDGRYTFDPLGKDGVLFNRPEPEQEVTHLAEERNVSAPLRRRPLFEELEARRQALVAGQRPQAIVFGANPVFKILVRQTAGDPLVELKPEEIAICNLEQWQNPASQTFTNPDGTTFAIQVAADPVLGRLAFPTGVMPHEVKVSYAYGFSGDVGGGPYNRREIMSTLIRRPISFQVGVSKELAPVPNRIFRTLKEAVQRWNGLTGPNAVGMIVMLDSSTYEEDLTGADRIIIPQASQLSIVAYDWPRMPPLQPPPVEPDRRRPHIRGDIAVVGMAQDASGAGGELILEGLLVEGDVRAERMTGHHLGFLRLSHCTLPPGSSQIVTTADNPRLTIALSRTICGRLRMPHETQSLNLEDCIVDSQGGQAIEATMTAVRIERSTLFGSVHVRHLDAGNSIFLAPVLADRRQQGCIRFSYLPRDSKTPRRFRCQPDLALETAGATQQALVLARVVPSFTSEAYGHFAYGQLRRDCDESVRTGAEDGSEMGAFSFLKQPQREANLRESLDEYLRLGLEAGLIYVT